jgi:hypothetical protein
MTTDGLSIAARIRKIARADYDGIIHPGLPEREVPAEVTFMRILELARFWNDPDGGESLAKRQQRLVASLYGISCPWAYLVLGEGGITSVFMGLSSPEGEARSWGQRLAAQLPGSVWRVDRTAGDLLKTLAGFGVIAGISGNPSLPHEDGDKEASRLGGPGLESLFESMAGLRWAYMVMARPMAEQEVADFLGRNEAELLEINSSHRRRGSSEEDNNPEVTRYVALLESANRRLIQGQKHGMWEVQAYLMTNNMADCRRGSQALHAAFGGPGSEPQPFRIKEGSRHGFGNTGSRLATRLNTAEVGALASLPRREVAGLQVVDHVTFGMAGSGESRADFALGTIMSGGTPTARWYEIQAASLCRHVFVAGVPGSGKTRTCMYMLSQLWREHQIPWLVLEPSMKCEYRALLRSAMGPDLMVFTAGDESVAPLRLNPLEVPHGIHVQTHIGGLTTLFKAAFAMEAPMPYVLDEAIHRVYEDRGWDFVTGTHPRGGDESQPTLGDLLETCNTVVEDLGYDRQLKGNIQAALRTRLSSLMRGAKGHMLNMRQPIPMDQLLAMPTVVEFSAIGDDEEKAFLVGCLLLKLAQYRQAEGLAPAGLRHVTLIEEAHRVLRNVQETIGTSVANPRRQAIEAFCNMLAELRAFGEGLVVVDQMPSKLVPDVIRNSGLKLVHRLTAEEERSTVGGAMSLNEEQRRFLSSLPAGQAIAYADGGTNASRISIPDHAGREGFLRELPTAAEVGERMRPRITAKAKHTNTAGASMDFPSPGCPPFRCLSTCPADGCARRQAVHEYAARQAGSLDASFAEALSKGFAAVWEFGEQVSRAAFQESGLAANAPLCAAMAVASRTGMHEGDMDVLRQNLLRVRDGSREGGEV